MKKTFEITMMPSNRGRLPETGVMFLDSIAKGNLVRNVPIKKNDVVSNITYTDCEYQHLYVFSTDEVRNGDWYYDEELGYPKQRVYADPIPQLLVKKIIASTDKNVTPAAYLSDTFISYYIKKYNEGEPVVAVELDMVDRGRYSEDYGGGIWCPRIQPVVEPCGQVIVHSPKLAEPKRKAYKVIMLGTPYKDCQIYIISDDKIKEGDPVWNQYNADASACTGIAGKVWDKSMVKIVASTDKSLTIDVSKEYSMRDSQSRDVIQELPTIPNSFIPIYIEAYNRGEKIKEIELEVETVFVDKQLEDGQEFLDKELQIKVDKNGSVIIHLKEEAKQ